MSADLDLALIGNCTVGALVDPQGRIVWSCFPRFDGDPVFCSLVNAGTETGFFDVELIDFAAAKQEYLENTAVLRTRLEDSRGGSVEITDFAPRFSLFGRRFRPIMLVRRIRRTAGSPRIRIRLRPVCDNGRTRPTITWGSNHIRYVMATQTLRLTTDVSITAILDESAFFLEDTVTLLLGPDETVHDSAGDTGRRFLEETERYWHEWVRFLGIPFEWQEAVIRAAITLKLNAYDDTGAIIAAMTTSIPESANSGRNWDYRYCWLRDGYFVVSALNRLGATRTMERYLAYIVNVAAEAGNRPLQPVFGIDGRAMLGESVAEGLSGYRGMGPVRIGNLAYAQVQHDVYGSAVLSATHIFFDQRLTRRGDTTLFHQLEALGERAARNFDQPDAGLWELRGSTHIHTFSAVMCWAACDRLTRIATRLQLPERAAHWRQAAQRIHAVVCERAWNWRRSCFTATFDGSTVDASLLLLAEVGFLDVADPRFATTVAAIENDLQHEGYIFRYADPDDFGPPENAFLVCTFWYVNALAALDRRDEARAIFERLLRLRNRHGLLAEHVDPKSGEQWGNFVQTYSMVGLINAAIRLSVRWDQAF